MKVPAQNSGSRGSAQVVLLWVAAILVLVLGVVLIFVAVGRQPPRVQTTEVLPAPTVALPTMPAGMPGAGQLAMPQGGSYPAMPQSMPGAMPGGMPVGMPPGGMMPPVAPPPTAAPTPTPTPPITETFACREGLEFKVEPEEAVVTINGEVIGRARLWSEDEAFEFPGPGRYYVRISSPGYKDFWCKVSVSPDAEEKTKKIEVELSKLDD